MSFGGQSNAEKQNDLLIKQNNQQLSQTATSAANRGAKAFKFFKQSTKPAMDFWTTLLSGDRNAITQFLSPELSNISNNAKNSTMQLWNAPRGGGKISAQTDIMNNADTQYNNLFSSVRPQAAGQLANLGGMFGNLSLGEGGLGVNALSGSSNNLFGLNQEQQRIREQKNAAWGAIGQGVGGIAGSLLGGIGGGASKATSSGASNAWNISKLFGGG